MSVVIKKKKKIASKKGMANISKKHANGAETVDNEVVVMATELSVEPMATVHVDIGNTVNTGNYESSRFSVGLTMPTEIKDIDKTYEFCQTWANDRLAQLNEELQEVVGG